MSHQIYRGLKRGLTCIQHTFFHYQKLPNPFMRGWTGGAGIEGAESGVKGAESGVEGAGSWSRRGREEGQLWAGVWKDWRAKLLFFYLKIHKK